MAEATTCGHTVNANVQICKLESEANWSGWKNLIETYLRQIPNTIKLLNGEYTAPSPLNDANAATAPKLHSTMLNPIPI